MPKVTKQTPTVRKQSNVPDVIARIGPIQKPDRGLQIAIYGRSGSGKTTLACSFPKPLVIVRPPDDDGRLSVYNVSGVDDAPVNSVEEMEQVTEYLAGGKYKTIVLDNMSALQELVLKKVLGMSELPAQLGWGTATQQQWGEVGAGMKELMRKLLEINCSHIVLLAQEREFNTDSSVSDVLAPYVNCGVIASVASWVGPKVDYLCNTFLREHKVKVDSGRKIQGKTVLVDKNVIQYCLRTGPHPVYNTKFRVPKGTKLPDVVVDPNFNDILALIEGRTPPKK